jgi:predicted dehydrogenase
MLKGVTAGCGFFSRIQMESWKRVRGAEIAAACDLDPAKRESFTKDFGLRAYADAAEMLDVEKPDFLDIATRPASHLPLVREAAKRGIAVLCQKPAAETWQEACEIARTARQAGIRCMINENWRWQAWYRRIHELLGAGRAGKLFYYHIATRNQDGLGQAPYPNQPYFAQMPRLLVFETVVHHIDTARFLLGEIEEVYCQTQRWNPVIQAEDFAILVLRHANGIRGVIDANRLSPPDEAGPAMEVSRFEGFDNVIRLFHSGDVLLGDRKEFSAEGMPGYRGDSCRATQQHFADCLASGKEFETEAADYLRKTLAVVEACYRSAAENRPVGVSEFAHEVGK